MITIVAEDASPVGDALIGGQQDATGFVTGGDQLKQQMGGLWRHREVAEFVDNQQFGAREAGQADVLSARLMGLLELRHQGRRADEQNATVEVDRRPTETDG